MINYKLPKDIIKLSEHGTSAASNKLISINWKFRKLFGVVK